MSANIFSTFSEWREAIRQRVKITDLVRGMTTVGSHGDPMMCKCPFHADNGPSLAVYVTDGRWRCFGSCQDGGDIFDWVAKRDHVAHTEAVRILAREAGVDEPKWSPESQKKRDDQAAAEQLLKMAAEFYTRRLWSDAGKLHREYMYKRGFDDDDLRAWQAGASGESAELVGYLHSQKADMKLAEALGLVHTDKGGGRKYDHFRDRVMIPFVNGGRVTYMTGRAIKPEVEPKYLHLHNSEYCRKSVYGGGRGRHLVIVEGPFDVWALRKLGGQTAVALMGLGTNDPTLVKAVANRDRVWIGTDSDGTVRDETVRALAHVTGVEKTRLVTWPGGDDPAAWLVAGATGEALEELLEKSPTWGDELVDRVEVATDKVGAVKMALEEAVLMEPLTADQFIGRVIAGAKKAITPKVIRAMYEEMRNQAKSQTKDGGALPERADERKPYYYVFNGELTRGNPPEQKPARVMAGGYAHYIEVVRVDDGDIQALELTLEVVTKKGEKYTVRVPAAESGDSVAVTKAIRGVAGVKVGVEPGEGKYLPSAVDAISTAVERVEIARTGWVEVAGKWAFVTPGGVVGELPENYRVQLPEGFERFAVKDGTDEEFMAGMDGVVNGFLKAFGPESTIPMLAFGLLPVAARWLPYHKFALHVSGETGSLKTEACKILMSLYGDFAESAPLVNWRSTINSIEQMGWWLPNALGLVDDYKPRLVKTWEFAELIQRYADGNARLRLNRASQMTRRQAMRWWLLSTGEDLPVGESSVLARMIILRLPRRPAGAAFNAALAKAKDRAKYFPVVTARWAAWLEKSGDMIMWRSRLDQQHQVVVDRLQEIVPDVPNVNRIARNMAVLWVVWNAFWDFVEDNVPALRPKIQYYKDKFAHIVGEVASSVARHVVDEKPVRVFISAVQRGIDSQRFAMVSRGKTGSVVGIRAGWFDPEGVYLLPSMYEEVSKWMRESGQEVGFTRNELYRLLDQEGVLARKGIDALTVTIHVGAGLDRQGKRVLHFKPGVIQAPESEDTVTE